jgi:uncharacterized protein YndB with AHSA1/START domain
MTSERPPEDPRDLRLHREVDAPRDLVWTALTQAEHLGRWWGPSGFRTETHSHDLRPGGSWRLTMHGPDGRAYGNHAVFDEVVAPERLVLRYVEEPGTEPARHVTTITLDALGPARTRITLTLRFPSAEERKEVVERYGAADGGRQTLDRLAALLSPTQGVTEDDGAFVLRRVLAAPLAAVWGAWTDAAHLGAWFHPAVWTIVHSELDLRVGGTYFYGFQGPELPLTWALWRFTEIEVPKRLGFVLSFADAERRVARSPFGGPWPPHNATQVTRVRHAGIGGGTLLTLRSTPIDATDDEQAAFRGAIPSMAMGWGQTIDSLAAFVAPSS